MSKDANGPTNGGSKFKVVGGTVIADEKEKTETWANTCTVSVLRQDGAATSGILCIWQ